MVYLEIEDCRPTLKREKLAIAICLTVWPLDCLCAYVSANFFWFELFLCVLLLSKHSVNHDLKVW